MGGFLGIGGSSAKTDRSNQLTSFSELKNIFNWALPTATSTFGAGQGMLGAAAGSLGQVGNYFKNLLSGNRAATLQAVAPETSAVTDRYDAARKQLATSGTARGGGTAGAEQTSREKMMAEIDNLLFGVRPAAAKGLEETARTEAGVGATELGAATNLLGIGEGSAGDLGSLALKSRGQSFAINRQTQQDVAGAIEGIASLFV